MQYLPLVNVLERQAKLDEPLHDSLLREVLLLLAHFLHVVSQVAHLTELHDYDQLALVHEASLVRHYVRMAQFTQQHRLLKALLFLLLLQLSIDDLLGDKVDFLLVWRRVPVLDEKGGAEIPPTDAFQLLEFLLVAKGRETIRLILLMRLLYLGVIFRFFHLFRI